MEDEIECSKKVKLEIVVPENRVEDVVQAICANAHTGHAGAGSLWAAIAADMGVSLLVISNALRLIRPHG